MRPQLLALRAANQYRTRDIIAYLGLRYYFANQCARRDRWADDISSHLVMCRSSGAYFQSLHFKDVRKTGHIDHREIFLPGPNESFAEAALLAECAKHSAFRPHASVFSYRLSDGEDTQGVYKPYFSGLVERQEQIALACKATSNYVVRYTDIKRFYPNIQGSVTVAAWKKACDASQIPPRFRELGLKILADHISAGRRANHGNGLLTGPMFSHLVANLVLRDIDEAMAASFPGRYFRYVDDVVLVGTQAETSAGRAQLATLLSEQGLDLHEPNAGKDFELGASDWLVGEGDFCGNESRGWMVFARDLKQFLIAQASSRSTLAGIFAAEGFRIPLPDYSVDVSDARYQDRFFDRLKRHPWLLRRVFRQSTTGSLLLTAQILRQRYSTRLNRILELGLDSGVYHRKRMIPKLRYLAGRLLYLGRPDELAGISERLKVHPELFMLAEALKTVSTRDVTHLLTLGSNVVQTAAQALKLDTGTVSCGIDTWGTAERQGLAILRANGISITGPADDELNRFILWQENASELLKSEDPFIQEVACLHGISGPRHQVVLNTAFDRREELAFDATTPIDTY